MEKKCQYCIENVDINEYLDNSMKIVFTEKVRDNREEWHILCFGVLLCIVIDPKCNMYAASFFSTHNGWKSLYTCPIDDKPLGEFIVSVKKLVKAVW